MAFTEAQKVKLRSYLGFPAFQTFDTSLESSIDLVGSVSAHQTEVETVLAALATIETQMISLHARVSFLKAEDVTMNQRMYDDLRNAGRREVTRLETLLGCKKSKDVFGLGGEMGFLLPIG